MCPPDLVGLRCALISYQLLYVSGGLVANSCDYQSESMRCKKVFDGQRFERTYALNTNML